MRRGALVREGGQVFFLHRCRDTAARIAEAVSDTGRATRLEPCPGLWSGLAREGSRPGYGGGRCHSRAGASIWVFGGQG